MSKCTADEKCARKIAALEARLAATEERVRVLTEEREADDSAEVSGYLAAELARERNRTPSDILDEAHAIIAEAKARTAQLPAGGGEEGA